MTDLSLVAGNLTGRPLSPSSALAMASPLCDVDNGKARTPVGPAGGRAAAPR